MSLLNQYAGHHKLDQTLFKRGVDFTNASLFAPLWNPRSKVSPFISFDKTGHTITVAGATWSGPYGRTLDGVDDYLTIPKEITNTKTEYSIELVFKLNNTNANYLISRWGSVDIYQFELGNKLEITAGFLFAVAKVAGGRFDAVGTTVAIIGKYYHLMGTLNSSFIKLYVNGVLEASTAITEAIRTTGTEPIYVSINGSVSGIVSEIYCSDIALTQAIVTQHYLAAKERLPWANLP